MLAGTIAFSAASLTRYPPVYGDEPTIASTVASLYDGNGLQPSILSGSGLYDGHSAYWTPLLGSAPFLAVELVGGTTLTAHRAAAWCRLTYETRMLWHRCCAASARNGCFT